MLNSKVSVNILKDLYHQYPAPGKNGFNTQITTIWWMESVWLEVNFYL